MNRSATSLSERGPPSNHIREERRLSPQGGRACLRGTGGPPIARCFQRDRVAEGSVRQMSNHGLCTGTRRPTFALVGVPEWTSDKGNRVFDREELRQRFLRELDLALTDKLSLPGADARKDYPARGHNSDGLRDCSESFRHVITRQRSASATFGGVSGLVDRIPFRVPMR